MKLDQLPDLERGEILGFIQGYAMAAPGAKANPIGVEVRTQFTAVNDEADFLEIVREAGQRMRARGKQLSAEGDALSQLVELMSKDEPN